MELGSLRLKEAAGYNRGVLLGSSPVSLTREKTGIALPPIGPISDSEVHGWREELQWVQRSAGFRPYTWLQHLVVGLL